MSTAAPPRWLKPTHKLDTHCLQPQSFLGNRATNLLTGDAPEGILPLAKKYVSKIQIAEEGSDERSEEAKHLAPGLLAGRGGTGCLRGRLWCACGCHYGLGVRPRRGRTRREISPAVGGARAGWIGILHGGEVDEGNGPEVLAQGLLEGGRGHGRRGSFGVPARGVGGAFSMRWRSRWRVRSSCRVFWRVEIERSSEVTKNGEPTISVRPDYRQRREEEEKLP